MSGRIDYRTASPAAFKAMLAMETQVRDSGLEHSLIELVKMRVSQINGCAYCLDMHTRDLIKRGVTPARLALVQAWHEAGAMFSERERAALAWAETVTLVAQTHVPDEAFQAAAAVFGEKELSDLTMAIGLMNAYNRLAISFRREPDSVVALQG